MPHIKFIELVHYREVVISHLALMNSIEIEKQLKWKIQILGGNKKTWAFGP